MYMSSFNKINCVCTEFNILFINLKSIKTHLILTAPFHSYLYIHPPEDKYLRVCVWMSYCLCATNIEN